MHLPRLAARLFVIVSLAGTTACADRAPDGAASGSAGASASAADTAADLAAAKKALEPLIKAIATYRSFVDAGPQESSVADPVGALAANEVARAVDAKLAGEGAIIKGVSEALKRLSTACGTDVSMLGLRQSPEKMDVSNDHEKIVATRKACSGAIKAFEGALAALSSDLPKVPAADAELSAKTPLGTLVHGGPAVKAYREALTKETTTREILKELGRKAIEEHNAATEKVGKAGPEGGLLRDISALAAIDLEIKVADVSIALGRCEVVQMTSELKNQTPANKEALVERCGNVKMPKVEYPVLKPCRELVAKVCP